MKAQPIPIIIGVLLIVLAILIDKKPSANTDQESGIPTDPEQ